MTRNTIHPEITDAARDTNTRFGVRPAHPDHKIAAPYAYRRMPSSKVPPSGAVTRDGRHAKPEPALTTKLLLWGGVGAGVLGATMGALMIARRVADAVDGDPRPPHSARAAQGHHGVQRLAPNPVHQDERARDEMRRRVATPRPRRGNMAQDLTDTATDLTNGLTGMVTAITGAFHAFRSVSQQANGIVSEFAAAADELRSIARVPRDHGHRDDDDRMHRL
ncbi:hypothetical protein [Paracoccus sp. (in: a-proteobacteria)]|uniref:hypothetical protein n=1 Tax=Paracoccus sp. TaxID=267 RepID=UPI0026DEC69A|nr:hypothetical protein [Paracoccus sp. (in: a-proteobacteria)]MDO5646574.1 hypothetical protein [Paracoccus sp. (in: a-proteobacteria)]